jgi:transposase
MDIRELILHIRVNPSNRAVARDTGFDRRTVQRYRQWVTKQKLLYGPLPSMEELKQLLDQTLPIKKSPQLISSVEPYRQIVEEMYQGQVDGTAIWERLKERGYEGGLSSVYRFLRHLTPPEVKATVRVERGIGEEAQVDFGYVGLMRDPVSGLMRKTWAFVMTLSYSRHQYVEFVFEQSLATWLNLHRHALEFFGGVPRRIVTDNLKSAVTKAYWDGHDPQLQATYRECAEYYGFLISPCRPRTPQHKGKVEAGVKFLKTNFMGGRIPTDLNLANQEVKKWCLERAGQRKHGTTHQQPLVVFEQVERTALLALPTSPYELAIWKEVRLHRDCYVVFDNAFYSAPFRLIGQKLRVRAGINSVKLYDCDYEVVATHTRATRAGERITNQAHLPPHKLEGLNQNREGVQAEADQIGSATSQLVKAMLDDPALDRLPSAARLVRLSRQFGNHRLEAACQRAAQFGEESYRTVKNILVKELDQAQAETVELPATTQTPYRYARNTSEILGHLFGKAVGLVSIACSTLLLGRGGPLWN